MQIIENKALLFRTRNPEKYSIIPKHKIMSEQDGTYEVAVYFGLDECRVLKNLGVKDVPSPILTRYNWPGKYKPMAHQIDGRFGLVFGQHEICKSDNPALVPDQRNGPALHPARLEAADGKTLFARFLCGQPFV